MKSVLLIFSTMFPIVNPLGGTPIFLSLTPDFTSAEREILALRVTLNCLILLIASMLVGTHILSFFGISLPVVQVGGGLVVITTGWTMLKWTPEEDPKAAARQAVGPRNVLGQAFYPLTLPITVGPGSISVAITLGANLPRHAGGNSNAIISAVIGSLLIAATVFLCYGFADKIARWMGETAMGVVMRLSSFILVCIGVQILWNGARALLETLR